MCRLAIKFNGEVTLDIGPGAEICTPALGMGGVGVKVGVRDGRGVAVALRSGVLVALGDGLEVGERLKAGTVWLGLNVAVFASGVGVEEAGCVSTGTIDGEIVGVGVLLAWTVMTAMVGIASVGN